MLRTLGVGGMGEVFLAERADAEFEQRVAIKVVYGGSLTRGVQSRLKMERQILAQLDHPNIAHLLDGGALPDGTRLHRHGIRRRHTHRRLLRLESSGHRRPAQAVSDRLCRSALRPSEPHRTSRPEALEYLGHRGRHAQTAGFRHRQTLGRAPSRASHAGRHARGHSPDDARPCQPGAGPRTGNHHVERCLRTGRAAL